MTTPITINLPVTTNATRIQHAIDTMQAVVDNKFNFNINSWFANYQDNQKLFDAIETGGMAAVNECGTAACVLGWIATTPEFKEAGGKVEIYTYSSTIRFEDKVGMDSGIAWFGDAAMAPLMFPGSYDVEHENDIWMPRLIEAGGPAAKELFDDINNELYVSAYPVNSDNEGDSLAITAQDALDVLKHIQATGCIKLQFFAA